MPADIPATLVEIRALGTWSAEDGDLVCTHPDGSLSAGYLGEHAEVVAAALATLAKSCVLDVETLRHLTFDCGCEPYHASKEHQAALAAAEAEVARVEGQR